MSEEGVLHMALPLADLQANTNTMRASAEFGGRVVCRGLEEARTGLREDFLLLWQYHVQQQTGPDGDGYCEDQIARHPHGLIFVRKMLDIGHDTSSRTADEIFFYRYSFDAPAKAQSCLSD